MFFGKGYDTFLEVLRCFDQLSTISNAKGHIVVQNGDLAFIKHSDPGGEGFIGYIDTPDKKNIFQRVYRNGDKIITCCETNFDDVQEYHKEEVTIKGKVVGLFRWLEDEPNLLDYKDHPVFKAIENPRCGNYSMTMGELVAIADKNKRYPFECIGDAFNYGFVKGQRAEKARSKRVRQKAEKREVQNYGETQG